MNDDMPFQSVIPLGLINYAPLIMGVMIYIVYRYMRNSLEHVNFAKKVLNGDFDYIFKDDSEEPLWKNGKIRERMILDQRRNKSFGYLSLIYLIFLCAASIYVSYISENKYSFALLLNAIVFCACLYDGLASYVAIKETKKENKLFDEKVSAEFFNEFKSFLKKEKRLNYFFLIFNIAGAAVTAFMIYLIVS